MATADVRRVLRGLRPPRLRVPLGGRVRLVAFGPDTLTYAHGSSGSLKTIAFTDLQAVVDRAYEGGLSRDGEISVPIPLWREHRHLIAAVLAAMPHLVPARTAVQVQPERNTGEDVREGSGDAYITLWSQPQLEVARRAAQGREALTHAANDQFRARGVKAGDRVYVVATRAGRLLLVGRLTVERVVDQREARKLLGPHVYQARDHLIGHGTRLRLDQEIPETTARALERESGKPLKIDSDEYRVDANSLRTTGRITARSARALDALLDEASRVHVDTGAGALQEGRRHERRHEVIERSAAVRARALALHGTDCQVCGFSFAKRYGPLGRDFAEVHHLMPLGHLEAEMLVDPAHDVAVVCANCHRMIHRRDPPLAPDDLRELLT